jgi:hypothetical protein
MLASAHALSRGGVAVRRIRLLTVIVVMLCLFVLAGVLANGFSSEALEHEDPPSAPGNVTVTFGFLGGPSLIFLCWTPPPGEVTFYDVEIRAFNNGNPMDEVRYGLRTTDCGGAIGAGQYMWEQGLFHFAVRACNNGGCSGWADATGAERYWFEVPCSDPSGDACTRPF